MTKDREVSSFTLESRYDREKKKEKKRLTGGSLALKGTYKLGQNTRWCYSSCCSLIGISLGLGNDGGPATIEDFLHSITEFLNLH